MPIRVERSVDDPLVTVTFENPIEPEDVQEAQAQTVQLLDEMGTYYAVINLQGADLMDKSIRLLIKWAAHTFQSS